MVGKILGDLVGGLMAPVTDWFRHRQRIKEVEVESKVKVTEAKTEATINKMLTQQQGDIAWENTSINQSGWKDEWFTIVLSIPAILCFFPTGAGWVTVGFAALATCPQWYQWMLGIAVGSAFGYRKIADFMALKKGV